VTKQCQQHHIAIFLNARAHSFYKLSVPPACYTADAVFRRNLGVEAGTCMLSDVCLAFLQLWLCQIQPSAPPRCSLMFACVFVALVSVCAT
jgi:hypothetical protein